MAKKALIPVLMVSLVAITLALASNGKPKPLADRVADLEEAVNDLQSRVAALEGKPAKERVADPFQSCREWGKGSEYVKKMTADYKVLKDAGLSEDDILTSSLDACVDRVGDPDELPACRACMTAIIRELFKD